MRENKGSIKVLILFVIGLLLICKAFCSYILFVLLGILIRVYERKKLQKLRSTCTQRVSAYLESIREYEVIDSMGICYSRKAEYSYSYNGFNYSILSEEMYYGNESPGSYVEILINPNNPVEIYEVFQENRLKLIVNLLSIVCVVLGIMLFGVSVFS